MNIILLTQDDPFYLGRNIDYLLKRLPDYANVVGCVVFDASPFGGRESFLAKAKKTLDIFGGVFFARYAARFVLARVRRKWQVKSVLQRRRVPLIEITGSINSEESIARISAHKPDLLISIAGNQIFKRQLFELPPKGCLNLHTALLPKYRGLMPSFWVLKNGESETGVSVFFVDDGIDSGKILVQKRVEIGKKTQEELIEVTKKLGMDAIVEAVTLIHAGDYRLIDNDAAEMTYFSFPTKEDVQQFRASGKRFF